MYPYNRFLGLSESVTLDGVNQIKFENVDTITIHNLNIDSVSNLNNVNGDSTGSSTYLMAGEGKVAGFASYVSDKADPELANMCDNYESQAIANYKEKFGLIDFEESDEGVGKFHASNGIVAPYFAAVSDKRAKSDIEPIHSALDKIMQLRGYRYNLKHTGSSSAGLMANELQSVMPEAVVRPNTSDPMMAVNYNAVIPLLLEGLKELSKKLEESQPPPPPQKSNETTTITTNIEHKHKHQ